MKKILKALDDNFERYITGVLMAWVVFWIFFQVLSRYVFKSIYWSGTEELARYSYIWMIFLGAALLSRDNAHLKVDILKGIIGEEKGVYIDIVWEIVTAAFFLYLTPFAWKICQASAKVGRRYPSSRIPQVIFQASLVALCVLMVFRNIQIVYRQIKGLRDKRNTGAETITEKTIGEEGVKTE